jgi:hypothetical protein
MTGRWGRLRLPDPPDYIWTQFRHLPDWLRVSADQEATEELLANLGDFEPLMRLVVQLWKGGLAGEPAGGPKNQTLAV